MLIVANSFVITPILKKLNYDPLASFEPVCLLTRSPNVLVVSSASEHKTLANLLSAVRAKPDQLTMAFQGYGSSQHIAFEKLKRAAKIDMVRAPFPGVSPATSALLSGQAASLFIAYPAVMEQVKVGKLRVLAVASSARVESLPDVPTIAEAGIKGAEEEVWFGLMAPAGTPRDKIAQLAAWFSAATMTPDIRSKLASLEIHPIGSCGADFADYLRQQSEEYGRVIREANIKSE